MAVAPCSAHRAQANGPVPITCTSVYSRSTGRSWIVRIACHQPASPDVPRLSTVTTPSARHTTAQLSRGRKRPLTSSATGTRITAWGLTKVARASAAPPARGWFLAQNHHEAATSATTISVGWPKNSVNNTGHKPMAASRSATLLRPAYGAVTYQATTSAASETTVHNRYATGSENTVSGPKSHATSGALANVFWTSMILASAGNPDESARRTDWS